MRLIMCLLAMSVMFTLNLEVAFNEQCQCSISHMKTCDELKREREWNHFLREWDEHYLEHAYILHGDKLSENKYEATEKKKKEKSRKQMHALLNALISRVDPELKLPSAFKGDALYNYLLKLITYVTNLKMNQVISTVDVRPNCTSSVQPKPTVGPKEECRTGYHGVGDNCYLIMETQASWFDALKACNKNETDLVHPMNVKEQTNLLKHLKTYTEFRGGWYWTGGKAKENSKDYIWAHDQSTIDYLPWASGEPSNDVGHNCIIMKNNLNFSWDNWGCTLKHRYICQQRR